MCRKRLSYQIDLLSPCDSNTTADLRLSPSAEDMLQASEDRLQASEDMLQATGRLSAEAMLQANGRSSTDSKQN